MLALFRFLAAVFLLIAVLAAVYDGTRTLAADKLVTTSLLSTGRRWPPPCSTPPRAP